MLNYEYFTNKFYEIDRVANEKAIVEVCQMRLHIQPSVSLDNRQQFNLLLT